MMHHGAMRQCFPILLIEEDTIDAYRVMSALGTVGLEDATYRVTDVAEAVDYLQAAHEHPKIILLGFKMPHMDGFNFLRRLRTGAFHTYSDVPVIAFDLESVRPDVARFCHKLGTVHILPKPLPVEEFVSAMRRLSIDPAAPGV
jgi:CheY-like chemotaxis protein